MFKRNLTAVLFLIVLSGLVGSCKKEESVNPDLTVGDGETRVLGVVDCHGIAGGDSVKIFYRNGSLINAQKTNPGGGFSLAVPSNTDLSIEIILSDAIKDTVIEITSGVEGSVLNLGNIRMCDSFTFIKIAAGAAHCLALRSDGTIWAWGNNDRGQLGINPANNNISSALPVQVGFDNSWVGIDAGNSFSLGLKFDPVEGSYSLWAWGANSFGQLGDGTTQDQYMPVRVGPSSFVIKQDNIDGIFAAGGNHSLAIGFDGTLWAWGANDFGQLGDGTTNSLPNYDPFQVGTSNNWRFVSARGNNSGAITTGGQLFLWGDNERGQTCGNLVPFCTQPLIPTWSPTQEYNMLNWSSASASCTMVGITANGELWGGGDNISGQLNRQVITGQFSLPCNYYWNPIKIVPVSGWAKASNGIGVNYNLGVAYGGHSLFLRTDGTLWGAGPNNFGALGNGPGVGLLQQIGLENNWKDIATGAGFSLLLKTDGTVWTMGKNDFGQIGNGISGLNQFTPFMVLL